MTSSCSRPAGGPVRYRSRSAALLAFSAALALAPAAARAQGMLPDGEPQAAPAPEAPLPPPAVKAASAVVMDAVTGTVLWEKNCRVRRPNASTTKIMAATLLIESGRLNDVVTFSDHARATPYANLNAKPNEQFRMGELLYPMMLRSSNDTCVAVGEHLSGAAWKFAAQMTARAHEIGAVDTNFVTTNGLYHPQHYSTAYDLALMARHAAQYPLFNDVVGTKSKTISRSLNWKDTVIKNHNKFLSRYPGADGMKTGYVRQSGRCLVASSTRLEINQPWRLITVVLNSPDTYGDSARMMDWGRKFFQPVFFAHKGETVAVARVNGGLSSEVPLTVAKDFVAIVRRDPGKNTEREIRATGSLRAPVSPDQPAGKLVGLIDGRPVGEVELVASEPVGQVWSASMAPWGGGSMLLAALLLGPRYVRAFAKGARRRRRRVASRRRELDFGGESCG